MTCSVAQKLAKTAKNMLAIVLEVIKNYVKIEN